MLHAARRTLPRHLRRAFSTQAEKATDKLWIFDTTLRDGEQSPGATLNIKEKVDIANQLSRLGVDICEAGFPIASQGDFEAVREVAKSAGQLTEGRAGGVPMRIAGLSRANKKDIERCYEAVQHAPLNRIHTFLASSDIHLEHKLNITRAECVKISSEMVAFARSLCDNIEFSPEDAGRSDPEFLVELCGAVIEAGATTINLPDTVGYTLPDEYASIFSYCIANTKDSHTAVWSTHCHNDLGLATANSLAAVAAGARQVEVTLNSLGERAGNTSLEEVVMALRTRPQHFPVHCDVNTTQIMRTSKMVARYTGIDVHANKAIVGKNAFAHESGIHQHGVLKHANTYEIITPESVGATGDLVLGKHSGKAAYKARLIELGYDDVANNAELLQKLVDGAKAVADQKKTVSDQDLEELLGTTLYVGFESAWELLSLNVQTDSKDFGNKVTATATVKLQDLVNGDEVMEAAIGVGPVDATFKAIARMVKRPATLTHYNITKIHGGTATPGNDALASVVLHIQERGGDGAPALPDDFPGHHGAVYREASLSDHMPLKSKPGSLPTYNGNGTSTDVIVASAKAYLDALNRMIDAQDKRSKESAR
jgi:2-isopropylmalate synthase